MRISTLTIYDQSMNSVHRQQGNLLNVGQQIASGKRVMTPADDPQAAARAVGVSQSKSVAEQFMDSRISARNSLSQQESVLNSVSDSITRAKTLMVQAATGTLSDTDRASVASELKGVMETILGQANATDGNGTYLFGGYDTGSQPFVRNGAGNITYVGDTNTRQQRIDASRLIDVADNGATVFQSVHSGAGYVAEAADTNTGSLAFTGPTVVNIDDPDYGTTFTLDFDVTAGVTTYSINGGAAQAYTPGEAITFGGLSLQLDGEPDDGDSLTMGLATDMSTDLFTTLENAIAVLENPAQTDSEKAKLGNTLNTVMRQLDNSLDNVLTVRASVGARLNELDLVDSVASNRILNYEQTLSDLVNLDYVEAISDYSMRQVGLQAAQKAFMGVTEMSLFQYLR